MAAEFIDYIEFAVDDLPAARGFYERAFGWTLNDYGAQYAGFVGADGTTEAGGLNATGSAPGPPLPLVRSADIDASLAAVEAAGGTIVEPPAPFPGGRRFVVADPAGNRLGVYQLD